MIYIINGINAQFTNLVALKELSHSIQTTDDHSLLDCMNQRDYSNLYMPKQLGPTTIFFVHGHGAKMLHPSNHVSDLNGMLGKNKDFFKGTYPYFPFNNNDATAQYQPKLGENVTFNIGFSYRGWLAIDLTN